MNTNAVKKVQKARKHGAGNGVGATAEKENAGAMVVHGERMTDDEDQEVSSRVCFDLVWPLIPGIPPGR
jgi:hypothetical protein